MASQQTQTEQPKKAAPAETTTAIERKESGPIPGLLPLRAQLGSFSRTIELPEGARADTAAAKFDKGVLEVELELSPEKTSRGRVIEIREGKSN